MDKNDNAQLHVTVHGRVQGVSFRYFVTNCAGRLELNGWVRNRFGGTVEVLAEGKRENLENLLQDMHQGPRSSNVIKVEHEWKTGTGEFKRFRVRMTR